MNEGHWMKLKKAVKAVRARLDKTPDVAMTLGSGLSNAFGVPEDGITIPCSEIPGFPVPTIAGHSGEFWIGLLCGKTVLIQRGRSHYYEGISIEDVSFATRMFALLEIPTLIVTNASGAINPDFRAGDLVLLTDHINMLGVNPLRGANID
ncbi:purine-nucleoside phosphorylase, partial [Candidatus Bipolaricaulota bacterium]|nr:purine-nucleoside phosphorylase [Candidatus Bipolaricaulota bacterium]